MPFPFPIGTHNYKMAHRFFLGGSGGSSAASIASSKTFFRPFCGATDGDGWSDRVRTVRGAEGTDRG